MSSKNIINLQKYSHKKKNSAFKNDCECCENDFQAIINQMMLLMDQLCAHNEVLDSLLLLNFSVLSLS